MNPPAIKFIVSKGGSTELARLLGLPKNSGPQTVNNWKKRGIPSDVILAHPDIFREFINFSEEQQGLTC